MPESGTFGRTVSRPRMSVWRRPHRERSLGVKLPPTNISDDQLEETRRFAARVADKVFGKQPRGN